MNFHFTCETWKFLAGVSTGWVVMDIIRKIYQTVKGK